MRVPNTTVPSLALAGIRVLLAGLCVVVGIKWAGQVAYIAAAWYAAPALFVALGHRWAPWLTIVMNAATVAVGLLVLPDFGRLHGGEIFAYAGVPAIVEIFLAVHVLRQRATPVGRAD